MFGEREQQKKMEKRKQQQDLKKNSLINENKKWNANVHVFKWCVKRRNRVEEYKEFEMKNKKSKSLLNNEKIE